MLSVLSSFILEVSAPKTMNFLPFTDRTKYYKKWSHTLAFLSLDFKPRNMTQTSNNIWIVKITPFLQCQKFGPFCSLFWFFILFVLQCRCKIYTHKVQWSNLDTNGQLHDKNKKKKNKTIWHKIQSKVGSTGWFYLLFIMFKDTTGKPTKNFSCDRNYK